MTRLPALLRGASVRLSSLAALVTLPGVAHAQTMNAEQFYQRAIQLQKKGALALFSMGKVKALMTEGKAAGDKARETRLATIAAGKKARYCPPEGLQSMDSSEFVNRLGQIPQSERARIDMTEAMTRILERKFPCKS